MKPIEVEAGQFAPDVDEMIEKAGSMVEKLEMDNSQIRNITGVEQAPMNHYHTNQELPGDLEEVTNKGASSESVSFIDANPHQTGSTLDSHENPSGGDPHPPSSYTHSSVGKPPSDIKKEIEIILKKRCPKCGDACGKEGVCKNVSCSVKKAGDPLAALLSGAGGGGPPDDMGGGPPGDMPPGGGEEDMPDDPMELGDKIKAMVDKLTDKASSGGGGPPDDMAGGPPGGPPGDMPPGGPPGPPGGM